MEALPACRVRVRVSVCMHMCTGMSSNRYDHRNKHTYTDVPTQYVCKLIHMESQIQTRTEMETLPDTHFTIHMPTYRHTCMDINIYTQLRLGNRSGTLVHIQLYKVRL